MSTWKTVLNDPFGDKECGIPDDRTLLSAKVKTRTTYTFVPTAQGGSPTNTLTSALIIRPRPWYHIIKCAETTSGFGVVTDITSAGGAYEATVNANAVTQFWPSGGASMVRCVAIGVTVTYLGTELNRAGRVTAGLLPVAKPAAAKTGDTVLSSLSTMFPFTPATMGVDVNVMRDAMQLSHTQRVSDDDLKLVWKPAGAPTYQEINAGTAIVAATAGGSSNECEFYHNPGQNGQAAGEMNLVILVENDYVTTASTAGNRYQVRVDAHWELVPSSQFAVLFPLTPSPFSTSQLQDALNAIDRSTVLFNPRTAMSFRRPRRGYAAQPQNNKSVKAIAGQSQSSKISKLEAAKLAAKLGVTQLATAGIGYAAGKAASYAMGGRPAPPRAANRRLRDEL